MYMKICPECKGKSYSASKQGKWTCPYCGKDLSKVNVRKPGNNKEKGDEFNVWSR